MATSTRSAALSLLVLAMAATSSTAQNSPQDFIDAHTAARQEVGLGQVWWDSNLEAYAQWYAGQRRGDCRLEHSDHQAYGYGENLYFGPGGEWSPAWTGVDAVNLWVAEKEYYDYESNSCSGPFGCGHYTQVVWHDSTLIGCARVDCDGDLGVFITCNYYPPGNYPGQRPWLAARSA